MKASLLLLLVGLPIALAPLVEAGPFIPPVCMQKSASARGTSVTAQVTCEVWVEVTHCPPVGYGPCWALLIGPLP